MIRVLLSGLIVLTLLPLAACRPKEDSGTTTGSAGTTLPRTMPYFSVFPVADSDYVAIVPLGNLNPPGHTFPTDHLYIYLQLASPGVPGSPPVTATVFAPGNIVIDEVETSEHVTAGYTDYGLHFHPADNPHFRGRFGHMFSLASGLASAIGATAGDCNTYMAGGETFTQCRYSVSIPASAGDVLGTTGGRVGQWALDFSAYDELKTPAAYANPARYAYTSLPYAVCALDYYEPAVRDALWAHVGNYDGSVQRTAPPFCGEVEQDEPGTAQGNWFLPGADFYPEDNHLALVHDNVDPAVPVFSVGSSVPTIQSGGYSYTPAASGTANPDFAAVTPGSTIYCFEPASYPIANTVFLVQMPDANTLRLEGQVAGGGTCPASPAFSGAETEFVR